MVLPLPRRCGADGGLRGIRGRGPRDDHAGSIGVESAPSGRHVFLSPRGDSGRHVGPWRRRGRILSRAGSGGRDRCRRRKAGLDEPTRCVVLILKTEHGAWGIRVDSANTIMSRESPEYHPPRMDANGPVLIGTVRRAGSATGFSTPRQPGAACAPRLAGGPDSLANPTLLLRCLPERSRYQPAPARRGNIGRHNPVEVDRELPSTNVVLRRDHRCRRCCHRGGICPGPGVSLWAGLSVSWPVRPWGDW